MHQTVGKQDLCVSSLPLQKCKDFVPLVLTPKYTQLYDDLKNELLGAASDGYVAVHLRRGDRCSEEYKGQRQILYHTGACGPLDDWIGELKQKLKKDRATSSLPVYVATDDTSEETTSKLSEEGFYLLSTFTKRFPNGVDYDGELLFALDFFLVDIQFMIQAKRR